MKFLFDKKTKEFIEEKIKKKELINIKVKPNSKENKIRIEDQEIIISLKKPALNNKANEELINIFKKNGYEISIKTGLKERKKRISINKK